MGKKAEERKKTGQQFIEKTAAFIKENQMIPAGSRGIVALSGGADSVCLLSVLKALETQLSIEISAVHVHHGLRGAEADRDGEFAGACCTALSVPFVMVRRDVNAWAASRGISQEEAGREVRYEVLESEARRQQASWIALAHHRDDNAETILHHLVRGSGLRGLGGIRPVQGNRVRPLLWAGREEIREYLTGRQLSWCEDSTNQSADYTRNRIRNQVIPLLQDSVNARAVENIVHAGEILAQADAFLEKTAAAVWNDAGRVERPERPGEGGKGSSAGGGRPVIAAAVLRAQEPVIRTYLFRRMLELAGGGLRDVTAIHFRQLDGLVFGDSGKRLSLPGGVVAMQRYGEFWMEKRDENPKNARADDGPQAPKLKFERFSLENGMENPKNQYTKWFDYDKIKDTLSVRFREPGDYITLAGGGRKSVQRYMIDEKIPREQRDRIPLLAEKNHVLWMIGYRISEYYKITEHTKTILQATADGGEEHGR